MTSTSSRLSVSLSAAAVLTCLAAIAGPSTTPRAHAEQGDLDAIANTVQKDFSRNCGFSLERPAALEVIAQAFARSEDYGDVDRGQYNGQKFAFKGSGDPLPAATTDAYKRGAGSAISNCDFKTLGVGFVRKPGPVDVVAIVFGIPTPPPPVAAPPAPVPQKPIKTHHDSPVPGQQVPPPAANTATIIDNVDIYHHPGGEGKPYDMVPGGTKVTVITRRDDKWVNISGDGVPGGSGWVWGDYVSS